MIKETGQQLSYTYNYSWPTKVKHFKSFNNRDLLMCALKAYISKLYYETFYEKRKSH